MLVLPIKTSHPSNILLRDSTHNIFQLLKKHRELEAIQTGDDSKPSRLVISGFPTISNQPSFFQHIVRLVLSFFHTANCAPSSPFTLSQHHLCCYFHYQAFEGMAGVRRERQDQNSVISTPVVLRYVSLVHSLKSRFMNHIQY